MAMLKVGERAPSLDGETSTGAPVSLEALRGKWVVVYFYPKANTPGCTIETKRFRDGYDDIRALGAEVVGVSVDGLEDQCSFASDHQITFPLVADHTKAISRAYGVLWPIIGRDRRATFVVNPQGIIGAVFHFELRISQHLDQVLEFLRAQRRELAR